VATQVVSENPHLYYEIQKGNDNTVEVSEHFRKVLDELVTAVAENDELVFTRYMGAAKQRLVSDESELEDRITGRKS
jgi:prephenate dehydrogenase